MEEQISITVQALVYINAATLTAIIAFGYKIIRFINRMEFKTDLMWEDYRNRIGYESSESSKD